MSNYTTNTWAAGDTISASALNNMETGITESIARINTLESANGIATNAKW